MSHVRSTALAARPLVAVVAAVAAGCVGFFANDATVGRVPPDEVTERDAGSPDAGGKAGGRYRTFLSDGFREDWDIVQATLVRVEAVGVGGAATTLFAAPFGLTLDLRELHGDNGPLFRALETTASNGDAVASVRVTMLPSLTLRPTGTTDWRTTPVAPGVARDGDGFAVVEAPLGTPRDPAETGYLVVDFDLSRFVVDASGLTPVIAEVPVANVDDAEAQAPVVEFGRVLNLRYTARQPVFELASFDDRLVAVVSTSSTEIVSDTAGAAPVLEEGGRVAVSARFDPAEGSHLARRIVVVAGAPALARGTIVGSSTLRRTAEITIESSEGLPEGTPLQAKFLASSHCLDEAGRPLQCAAIVLGAHQGRRVSVAGYPEASTGLFTTVFVRFVDDAEGLVEGTPGTFDVASGTLPLTALTRADGLPQGTTAIDAVAPPTALFLDAAGEVLRRSAFIAAVAGASSVRVTGTVQDGHLVVREARLTGP